MPLLKNLLPRKRARRVIAITILVPVLMFVPIFLQCLLNFGDSDLPPYQPDTPFETAFNIPFYVLGFPLLIAGPIGIKLGIDSSASFFLVILTPGLFWALILEVVVVMRERGNGRKELPSS